MLTPTQQEALQRHKKFHGAIAAKASERFFRKIKIREHVDPETQIEVVSLGRRRAVMITASNVYPVNVVFEGARSGISIDFIQRTVATKYGISKDELLRSGRRRALVLPRQVAMYLARELSEQSFDKIGHRFGRDHTTVQWGCEQVVKRLAADPAFAAEVGELRIRLVGEVA